MVVVKQYNLPPTELIPNSPHPLLHYPGLLLSSKDGKIQRPEKIHDLYTANGWKTQWIFRYGSTQRAHYHSQAHECMTVLTGSARIRFGVADTTDDLEESTNGNGKEQGGVEIEAKAGDVFILPAGTAHKTFLTRPEAEFKLLTSGGGHHIGDKGQDARKVLEEIKLDGFTMLGAYPMGGGEWDFAVGGENAGEFDKVWNVPPPARDPVLGTAAEGLVGLWRKPEGRLRAKL